MYSISIKRENGDIFSFSVESVTYTSFGIAAEIGLTWAEIADNFYNGKARGLIATSKSVKGGGYRIKRSGTTCDGSPVFTLECWFPAESVVEIYTRE